MNPTKDQILIAAAAIANARGMRRGVPAISNVLDLLPPGIRSQVMEDAEQALSAVTDYSDRAREIAERIAEDIFKGGDGETASRLVMEQPNKPLKGSGWCKQAIADRIERILKGEKP